MFTHDEDRKTYITYLVDLVIRARMTFSDAEVALRNHVGELDSDTWMRLLESFREDLHLARRDLQPVAG